MVCLIVTFVCIALLNNHVRYTFWVAVLVLLLTVVFGLVQSIEGGLQVYGSFKALGPGVS